MSDLTLDEIRELRAIHRAKGSNGLTMRLLDQLSRAQPLLELAEELAKLPGPEHYAGPDDIACAECGDAVGDGSPAHCDLCYRAISVRLSDLEEEV